MSDEIKFSHFFSPSRGRKLTEKMKDKLKKWWIEKRYNKVKTIEVNNEQILLKYIPLVVKDGDELKTGTGAIEINFDNIEKKTDIFLDFDYAEREETDFEEKSLIYWINADAAMDKGKFNLYYGCGNRWVRLLDRFFIDEEKGYKDNMAAVQHLH